MTYLSPEWRQKLLDAGFPAEELKLGVAEEILRRLPKSVATKNRNVHRLSINCNGGKRWQIMYGDDIFESPIIVDPDKSLANAAASMWMFLRTSNLLPND